MPKHLIHRHILNHLTKPVGSPTRAGQPASVLIPIQKHDWGWEILLTRRAAHLRHHPSQIAFPGGKPETTDTSLWETALRETHEELGIAPEFIQPISQLPELNTMTGFIVTPFVGILTPGYQITANRDEVDSILPLPIKPFLNPQNYHILPMRRGHKVFNVYFINQGGALVWGATARMLYHLALQQLDPDNFNPS